MEWYVYGRVVFGRDEGLGEEGGGRGRIRGFLWGGERKEEVEGRGGGGGKIDSGEGKS